MSQMRLALIGCGGMAKTHVHSWQPLRERLQIASTVDVIADRAKEAAALFPGARAATDYMDVLDDVDAVLIALPHHLHHAVAMDCLRAGKHVLLEKPMANTEQQCLDLIQAAKDADRTLMIAYCMRFHPLVQRMKALLDAETYGEVFQVSIWTEQLTHYPAGHWGRDAQKLGGGQLFSHGCHYIDILLWYLGQPLRGSHLGTNLGTPWMEREGTSNVLLQFEGGRLGYHFGTWGARGTRLRYAFHAHCTEGMLEADIVAGKLIFHHQNEQEVLLEAEPGKHTQNEMAHFLDCVQQGQSPLTDGPNSLQGLRVIWRLYEAEGRHDWADLRGLGMRK